MRRLRRSSRKVGELRAQLLHARLLLGELSARLVDDVGGSPLREARIVELGSRTIGELRRVADLALEPRPLGPHVDELAERQVDLGRSGERARPPVRTGARAKTGQP